MDGVEIYFILDLADGGANDLDYFCLRHFKHFLHMNMQGSFYLISTGPTKRPFPKLFFSGW